MSFNLPVVEILAMAVVSGLVTWATIHFSLHHARLQTDRALADARRRELTSTVKELSSVVQKAFDDKDTSFAKTHEWQVGIFELATSKLPHARDVVSWLITYSFVAVTQAKKPTFSPPPEFNFDPSGPSTYIVLELGMWLSSPDEHGTLLSEAASNLNAWSESGGLKTQPEESS